MSDGIINGWAWWCQIETNSFSSCFFLLLQNKSVKLKISIELRIRTILTIQWNRFDGWNERPNGRMNTFKIHELWYWHIHLSCESNRQRLIYIILWSPQLMEWMNYEYLIISHILDLFGIFQIRIFIWYYNWTCTGVISCIRQYFRLSFYEH